MRKVTQNLHADFYCRQVVVLIDYFRCVIIKLAQFGVFTAMT